MKKILFTALLGTLAFEAGAQQITPNHLKEIQSSLVMDGSTKALQNIISNETNLRKLTLNREVQGQTDHFFKYKVSVKGITDQHQSGRCWMFTSMNVLRPAIMKQFDMKEFDFSHNYNYFWDMFEKSNLFLENAIATADKDVLSHDVEFLFRSPVGDGGVWNLFYNIAEKYGVVPQSVMPETAHSNNTGQLNNILKEVLRTGGYKLRSMAIEKADKKEIEKVKIGVMKDVYRVLSLCLGTPPAEFEWRYETTGGEIKTLKSTPKDFYQMIKPQGYTPDTYVMIMNDPTREYYKMYEIANYRNTYEGVNWLYLNLPNDDIKKAAIASIKANEPMYASCDIVQYDPASGICHTEMFDYESLFGIKLDMDKKARILTRESGSAHAMTLIAVDTDESDRPLKWQFENSWGPSAGHNGFMTFTDRWFDEYMFRIVINKKYLDKKAVDATRQKPVSLPAWDYMY